MKCNKCDGELEIDFTKQLLSDPPKYTAKCNKCGNVEYILCSGCMYVGDINVGHDEIHGCQKPINQICEPVYYYESNTPSIIHNNKIKNNEKTVIVTDELLKQLKDTSDLLNSYKELKKTTELMNKYMKECIDKDHRIAVLEKALRNAVIEYDFAKYKEQSTTIENIERILKLEQKLITQAEKELEEKI